MKTGLTYIAMIMLFSFSISNVFAYNPSQFDKVRLKQSCKNELESPFKDFAGTPSCDKLKKIEAEENQPTYRIIHEQ
ncbi:MAG: hypothetical protein J6578_09925 [Snodgrassella sp.]|uniref:hypothetical protein n=1 Tax=Snodgrassella TaxID=1193515 RepID=UPI0008160BC6|nr:MULTISPECIES: hypothetical protein [Snodgrassella]MCO6561086.1 hypothetical protein [Gilliamella sp.]MCO6509083.1 hypothetical protein [Snodgrassella sp.]MCO6515731.1 hypothetical protein [Snodgrassella sp.]MCO6519305.1 hypothetical protein [Snodgrassella sp.]MCO6523211.1 hypothetical protein [Snodgrassella sp.]